VTRPARTFASRLLVASIGLAAGCSYVFVQRPHQVSPGRYEPGGCTTSRTAPAADVVIALLQGFRTIVALTLPEEEYRSIGISRGTDVALGTGLLLLFATSAHYGFKAVATCRELGGGRATPYQRPAPTRTSEQRRAEEAAEEAAVRARVRARAAAEAEAEGKGATDDENPGPADAGAAPP
jgi:hypothetical protein